MLEHRCGHKRNTSYIYETHMLFNLIHSDCWLIQQRSWAIFSPGIAAPGSSFFCVVAALAQHFARSFDRKKLIKFSETLFTCLLAAFPSVLLLLCLPTPVLCVPVCAASRPAISLKRDCSLSLYFLPSLFACLRTRPSLSLQHCGGRAWSTL